MIDTITAAMVALASGPWCGVSGWREAWRSHGLAFREGAGGDTACGVFEAWSIDPAHPAWPAGTITSAFATLTPFAGHARTLIWGSVAWDGRTPIAGGSTPCEVTL